MKTALLEVASYVPPSRVHVSDILRPFGVAEARIKVHERCFGFGEVRVDPGGDLTDLLVRAASELRGLAGQEHRVRYVMHARTMPIVAPYPANPLQDACRKLGLAHANAFCLTQHACASGLLGVDLAGKLLAGDGDPDALALILAGEKTFTSRAKVLEDTGVMGETAAAVLVGLDGPRDRVLGYATRTRSEFHRGAWLDPAASALFTEVYAETLAGVVRAALDSAGLGLADLALILPHNVNRMSWLRILKLLGLRGTDLLHLDNLAQHGHCFGADSFVSLRDARQAGRLRPGDRYLMTAVGLGATFSAMVFEH
ncbi:3-oxoacyl-[acyl-carrier-protein] synthase III C-terminal domain-containing protein [Dactylosporangium sp. AC04546]|uniref:3-oxoacyl-[acyl-carrier-protein] synthase III C-terminal domain-containing protein n=1 Tax=Dactylosporangium sp. AC04546 TaxID=2862460 RepID=UPI001EDF9EC4|nr:3-oxoacyl-[acyl-carrier-protein] synthase III C-terminal domain-containing protein [Dactylosporangium sp. AC04546]WVK81314.1 3-oxoacyl-[acyl-carrier-protein] synthase III C-terminal domain-containing protein [Dactylosporangium sp. AC04546]